MGAFSEGDLSAVREAGYIEAELVEIVAYISLSMFRVYFTSWPEQPSTSRPAAFDARAVITTMLCILFAMMMDNNRFWSLLRAGSTGAALRTAWRAF